MMRKQDSSRSYPTRFELVLFRICAWAVVAMSFVAMVTKAFIGKPGSVPFHYLLIVALIGSLFATFGPALSGYVGSRVNKLKFGSFEVELSDAAGEAKIHLKIDDIPPPTSVRLEEVDMLQSVNPFPATKLTGAGLYQYEKLSHRLYLLFDQVKDPNELDTESRENFRKLITLVGKAAHAMQHFSKSLEVLLWLNRFADRELNHDELRLLGTAFLWAAEETDDTQKHLFQNEAIPLLKRAIGQHPYVVVVTYNLGWALLSLKKYRHGVRQMRKCIKLDSRYSPWANWNIACGLKKLDQPDDVLSVLEQIPAGPWWPEIQKDDWFKEAQPTVFSNSFKELSDRKIKLSQQT